MSCESSANSVTLQKKLDIALSEPVQLLLESGAINTWPSIRNLLKHETDAIVEGLCAAVTGFELDQSAFDKMVLNVRSYARSLVEKKAREEAGKILSRMKDRYLCVVLSVSFFKVSLKAFYTLSTSGLQQSLTMMMIHCQEFGLERKTYVQLLEMPELRYFPMIHMVEIGATELYEV